MNRTLHSNNHLHLERLEDQEQYLNFAASYRSISVTANYVQSKKEFFFPLPAVAEGSMRTTEAVNISIGSRNSVAESLTLEGRLAFSTNSAALEYDIRRPDWVGNQKWKSSVYEIDLNAFYRPNEQVNVTFGLNNRSVFDLSDRFHIPSSGFPSTQNAERLLENGEPITTQAFFSQLSVNLSSDLLVVGGIRMERQLPYGLSDAKAGGLPEATFVSGRFEESQVEFIPRVAAIYKKSSDHIFKILYGEAINRPSFLQNITNTLDPDRDNLKPEKIRTLELNYISYAAKKYQVDLSLFRNSLTNLITRRALWAGGDYETFSDNGGKLVTLGIEMTTRARFADRLMLEPSATIQKTENEEDKTRSVAYSPKILAYLKAVYRISEGTSLALTSNYVDELESFFDITLVDPSQEPDSVQRGEQEIR
jgi:outer membrane receptor protein involved in Fe transport